MSDLFSTQPQIGFDSPSQSRFSGNFDGAGEGTAELFKLTPQSALIRVCSVFSEELADSYLRTLMNRIQWQQDTLQFHGKIIAIPRLQAWYGDPGAHYHYSGLSLAPKPFFDELAILRNACRVICQQLAPMLQQLPPPEFKGDGSHFNSVLCNLYRDGNDSVSWHSDNEQELGKNPVIASLSFGDTRTFSLKHKKDSKARFSLDLSHNTLLIMAGALQHEWQHQVAKTRKPVGPRINLTFRRVQPR